MRICAKVWKKSYIVITEQSLLFWCAQRAFAAARWSSLHPRAGAALRRATSICLLMLLCSVRYSSDTDSAPEDVLALKKVLSGPRSRAYIPTRRAHVRASLALRTRI